MAGLTGTEIQEKHSARLKGAQEDMRKGIERVTTAPGMLAAKQKDKMRRKILEAIDNDKWSRNVSSVSLSDWQQKMIEKGLGRVAAGLDAAREKNIRIFDQIAKHTAEGKAKIATMPNITDQDAKNRMLANYDHQKKLVIKK